MRSGLLAELSRAETYVSALERLCERPRRNAAAAEVSLGALRHHAGALGRRLARAVPRGEYRLGVAERRRALIAGKERELYRFSPVDTLVVAVVAELAREIVEPVLSPRLYSYRPGRSSLEALRDLGEYLRVHARERADPRERGLFVVQRDIRSYGESIRTDAESPLWRRLEGAFERAGVPLDHPLVRLTRQAIRPDVAVRGGVAAPLARGAPTGSPVQPIVNNLYLTGIDATLAGYEGLFYARFGDDLLLAHPDAETLDAARHDLLHGLGELELELNPDKARDLYFTDPGRAHPTATAWTPAARLTYLGARVGFRGEIGLSDAKLRGVLRRLRRRLLNTLIALDEVELRVRSRILCEVARRALAPSAELADGKAGMLRSIVDDRHQLRQLDYQIALMVAELAARRRGPRAFRRVSWRELRELGLPSLLDARNRRGAAERAPTTRHGASP